MVRLRRAYRIAQDSRVVSLEGFAGWYLQLFVSGGLHALSLCKAALERVRLQHFAGQCEPLADGDRIQNAFSINFAGQAADRCKPAAGWCRGLIRICGVPCCELQSLS